MESSERGVLPGQKTQYNNTGTLYLNRPDKLKVERTGELSDAEIFLKNGTFTVYGKKKNMYAQTSMPGNLDKTIDDLQEKLDIYLPASDLLYSNVYKRLTEDVISGTYEGQTLVGDVMCDELSFQGTEVDWKIWVESARKLPRKYVIISKKEQSSPQFAIEITDWKIRPNLSGDMFDFEAPAGAEKIEFLRLKNKKTKSTVKK